MIDCALMLLHLCLCGCTHMHICILYPPLHIFQMKATSSNRCSCYPFQLEPRKTLCLAWTTTLSSSLPYSLCKVEQKEKCVVFFPPTQETYCQPFCCLWATCFCFFWNNFVRLFKKIWRGICHNHVKSLAKILLTSAEDSRNVSAVQRKSSLLCNQWLSGDIWWGDCSRGFMNLIRKFYLDLTLLWCLSVVSTSRVR